MNILPTVLFLCTGNFYRSRYAEAWFNHEAPKQGLLWRAESRGFRPHLVTLPLSHHAAERLASQSVPRILTRHKPERVLESDFDGASLIVALYEPEHRPMMQEQFPVWSDRILYWQVPDIEEVPPLIALARIESEVAALIQQLQSKQDSGGKIGIGMEF